MKTEIIKETYLNENVDIVINQEFLPKEYLEKLKKEKGEIFHSILGERSEKLKTENGKIIWLNYYIDGELADIEIIEMKKGKKDGRFVSFYPNGKIKRNDFYKNGKANGHSKWYDEFGNIKSWIICKNNKIVETII